MTPPLADLTPRQRAVLLLTLALVAALPLVAINARTPDASPSTGLGIALVAAEPVDVDVREIPLTGSELVRPPKAAGTSATQAAYVPPPRDLLRGKTP